MAINKANTPLWMKVVLIVLAIVFVFGFVAIGASPFAGDGTDQPGVAPPGSLEAINQQFAPTIGSLTTLLQSDPASYTVLVSMGDTYFDWAAQVQQAAQTDATKQGADVALWVAAKDAYRRALDVESGAPPVTIDYAITLFYTGETLAAIEQAESIRESAPEFPPAWFNLGIFYGSVGDVEKAVENYERYVELDPEGKQGNVDFAKEQLASLTTTESTLTTITP